MYEHLKNTFDKQKTSDVTDFGFCFNAGFFVTAVEV